MADKAVPVYVGLGSNLDNPPVQIGRAIDALGELPGSRLISVSPLYRSAPMGPPEQPDYINAVAHLESTLTPMDLLDHLQAIEKRQGRIRGERWGARTLDLDLLLFGDRQIDSETLRVPHPGLKARNFVLVPLSDVAPDLVLPDGTAVGRLADVCSRQGLSRLDSQGAGR